MESLNCPSDYHKRLVVVKKRLLNGPSLLLRDEILFQYQTQKPLVALENTHIAVCSREKRKKNRETISNWKRYWFLKNKMYFSGFLFENKTNGFACCGRLNEMEKQLAEFVFFSLLPEIYLLRGEFTGFLSLLTKEKVGGDDDILSPCQKNGK